MRDRRSEIEKIHQEIFSDSVEHKYYILGVAQGMSFVYDLFKEYKHQRFTTEELLEVIEKCGMQDDKISGYFSRLIKSNQEDSKKILS